MEPFPTSMARETIAKELSAADAELILAALPDTPVAAASIGQVYKVILANGTALAVKVQRPDAAALVEDDRAVAISVAGWLETLRAPSGERLLQPAIVSSVDEFFSRLKRRWTTARSSTTCAPSIRSTAEEGPPRARFGGRVAVRSSRLRRGRS